MLFDSFELGTTTLRNRAVMAPMTRSRATFANTPNALMAEYYGQRASAGLIITEGASPSANGLGYARMPGLFDEAHVAGWRLVTDAVHVKGGKIVVQLMHTGRVSHVANLPAGAEVIGPGAVLLDGQMHTDSLGVQPLSPPRAMNTADIDRAITEFARSARLAAEAGFDGVELHAASGYLLEQFLNANINQRSDEYGGSAEARNRFVLDVVRATATGIGAGKIGLRLSPHCGVHGTAPFDGMDEQLVSLAKELSALGLMYLHVVDYSAMGMPPIPAALKSDLRQAFDGPFILAGGFDRSSGEAALATGQADLIAFGRPFLANPDLIDRMMTGAGLNTPDKATFYTASAAGYTDYPTLADRSTGAANADLTESEYRSTNA